MSDILAPSRVSIARGGDECRIQIDEHEHMTLTILLPEWKPDPIVLRTDDGVEVFDAHRGVIAHQSWCHCYVVEC